MALAPRWTLITLTGALLSAVCRPLPLAGESLYAWRDGTPSNEGQLCSESALCANLLRSRLEHFAAPYPLNIQAPRELARLRGVVVRADNDSGLADVEVRLSRMTRVARTDSYGIFVVDSLIPGPYTVLFRRVGFLPDSHSVTVREGNNERLRVRLRATTPTLAEVTVRASTTPLPLQLHGFEERRAARVGRFIGPDDLEKFPGRALSSLVQQKVAGFQVVRITRGSLSGGSALATRRFQNTGARRPQDAVCFAQVFVNGQRVSQPGSGAEPYDIDALRPEEVLGMEFYRGAAETPTEFNGPMAACGTVVIWTK